MKISNPFICQIKSFAFILVFSSCGEKDLKTPPDSIESEPTTEVEPKEQPEKEVDAEAILKKARWIYSYQDLHGNVIKDDNNSPISLFTREGNTQVFYKDRDGVEHRYHMRFSENSTKYYKIENGKTHLLEKQKLGRSIDDSDFLLDDLSLLALRGESAAVVGEDRVSGNGCYKIRLTHSEESRYRISYAWVSKKRNMMLRIIGYNSEGKPLKQIQTTDYKVVNGKLKPKRFRIDSFDPNTNKSIGLTYLEFR